MLTPYSEESRPLFSCSRFDGTCPENRALAVCWASEVDGQIDFVATPLKGKSRKESVPPNLRLIYPPGSPSQQDSESTGGFHENIIKTTKNWQINGLAIRDYHVHRLIRQRQLLDPGVHKHEVIQAQQLGIVPGFGDHLLAQIDADDFAARPNSPGGKRRGLSDLGETLLDGRMDGVGSVGPGPFLAESHSAPGVILWSGRMAAGTSAGIRFRALLV
jgi:hypothetical protein